MLPWRLLEYIRTSVAIMTQAFTVCISAVNSKSTAANSLEKYIKVCGNRELGQIYISVQGLKQSPKIFAFALFSVCFNI